MRRIILTLLKRVVYCKRCGRYWHIFFRHQACRVCGDSWKRIEDPTDRAGYYIPWIWEKNP